MIPAPVASRLHFAEAEPVICRAALQQRAHGHSSASMLARFVVGSISVPSKFDIPGDLNQHKYLDHCEMVSQVRRTQRALNGGNPGGGCLHRFSCRAFFRECPVELAFLINEAIAQRDHFGLHRFKKVPDLVPLLPLLGVGLSPLMQWIVIPAIGFWAIRRWEMSDR